MHVAVRCGLQIASRNPARLIAGRRYSQAGLRNFHTTSKTRLSLFPWDSDQARNEGQEHQELPGDVAAAQSASGEVAGSAEGQESASSQGKNGGKKDSPYHGSAARRWMRNRKTKDLPPPNIPEWFFERNVKLRDEFAPLVEGVLELTSPVEQDAHALSSAQEGGSAENTSRTTPAKTTESEKDGEARDAPDASESRTYRLNRALMSEVVASVAGGLSVSSAEASDTFACGKSHLKLHCPVEGGSYFLEKIVEEAGAQLQADIIRLDAQDIAELAGDYIKEGVDASSNSLWSLGFDACQQMFPRSAANESEDVDEDAEDQAAEEEDERDQRSPKGGWSMSAIPVHSTVIDIGAMMKKARDQLNPSGNGSGGRGMGGGGIPGLIPFQPQQNGNQSWNDLKLNYLLECLLDTNQAKRLPETPSNGQEAPGITVLPAQAEQTAETQDSQTNRSTSSGDAARARVPWSLPKTIVLVRGFKELSVTNSGKTVLDRLLQIVQKKRKEGQQIMIVGTTASADLTPEISRAAFESIQTEDSHSFYRTMVVTPEEAGPAGGLYYRDASRRIREINVRSLYDMMRRLSTSSERSAPQDLYEFATELNFGPDHAELSAMLEEQVFTFDEVHRIALTAMGNQAANEGDKSVKEPLQAHHLVSAMNILDESDEVKTQWARAEQQLQRGPEEADKDKESKRSGHDARLRRIRKTCNNHEKTLMRGVVDPENIRTTFADVHAPVETIEALKNLTTLSLTRPEAFKYGVLATDKITGLLLYGPPGTGKTLLAKAVAKESGATVLEVSGSDVYDMYVGESEKNVRAIFSLAKKLSPCVVFIDEADAIFASRGSGTNRNSHRELINQFLREWDGMTDTNAFIMVATNRPFDLDDAALRRLPRRLLVDLPVEKDREAILGIHLKDEKLDASVSLAQLAAQTPLYSGSDLKNLAVAAALTAVREENDAAAKHGETSSEAFVYPERRVLHKRHFDKGMEEITASVSEDMSSLGAIRKFDEKYGDRRGRRKRNSYGFTTGGEGVKEDAAKVRS